MCILYQKYFKRFSFCVSNLSSKICDLKCLQHRRIKSGCKLPSVVRDSVFLQKRASQNWTAFASDCLMFGVPQACAQLCALGKPCRAASPAETVGKSVGEGGRETVGVKYGNYQVQFH